MRSPARTPFLFLFLVLALGLGPAAAGPPPLTKFRRGDANGDALLDISDAIRSLEFLFLGGEVLCRDAADANDDGLTDISDSIAILGYLFLASEEIPAPGALDCGIDPSQDDLDCASQAACRSFAFSELVAVEFPPRGAMLTGSPDVTVRGRLTGEVTLASLTLNGSPVEVRADGRFEKQVAAQHGLNVLRFRAVDGSGEEITAAQSFLWADRYKFAAASAEKALIPGGLTLHLGQEVFDDQNPDRDDFASLAEAVIANFDINGALPNPLFTEGDPGCACSVFPPVICSWARGRASNAGFSSPDVTATLQAGGLRLSIEVRQISVDLTVNGVVTCIGFGPVTGTATASSARVSANVTIAIVDGMPRVTTSDVIADVVGLNIALDLGILGGLASAVVNLFSNRIAGVLEEQLASQLQSALGPALQEFLTGLSESSQSLAGTPLTLDTRLGGASLNAQRCRLEVSTAFTSPSVVDPRLGSILSPVLEPAAPPAGRGVAFGLSHDALNQLLLAAWKATEPPIDAGASIPPQGLFTVESLLLEPLLPPVVLPSLQAPWPLRLQMGDLAFEARLRLGAQGLLEVKGFASAALGADVKALDDRIGLEIGSVLDLAVEVTESAGDVESSPSQTAAALELLFPLVLGGLGGNALAELELPAIDLTTLGPGLPPGTLRARDLTVSHGPAHVYGGGNLAP